MSRKCANLILVVGCCILAMWTVTGRNTDIKIEDSTYDFSPYPDQVERCAKDPSQCVEFSTYPSAYIEMLIINGRIEKEWFQEHDIVQEEVVKTRLYGNIIEDDFKPSCITVSPDIQYPKGGITRNGEFVYIVQMKLNNVSYHQPTTNKRCARPKGEKQPCQLTFKDNTTIAMPKWNSYSFICDEEIAFTEMVGITTRGMVVRSDVEHSCCCVCKYYKDKQYK